MYIFWDARERWRSKRKKACKRRRSCFNSEREWKCLYIFTIGGQGLKNKVKEKLSKFRDDRNGRRIIVGRRSKFFWVLAHNGWLKAEDEVRKVEEDAASSKVGKKERKREIFAREYFPLCDPKLSNECVNLNTYIYTRREKIRREIIQFSSNGYFKNARFGEEEKKKKYESSSTKSYTLHEFLAKIWLPCLLLHGCSSLFFLFSFT